MTLFLVAQVVVVAYRLQFFPASTDPLTATPIFESAPLAVAAICNQPPTVAGPAIVVDPGAWAWDDPVNANKDCVATTALVLANLPAAGSASMAGYLATVTAYSATAQSVRVRAVNAFSLTNGPPPPPPPVFAIGATVQTLNVANVRATPAGTLLGTQPLGALGLLTAGPTNALFNGATVTWWSVNFTTGVDGWVGDANLMPVATAGHAAPTGVGIRP